MKGLYDGIAQILNFLCLCQCASSASDLANLENKDKLTVMSGFGLSMTYSFVLMSRLSSTQQAKY